MNEIRKEVDWYYGKYHISNIWNMLHYGKPLKTRLDNYWYAVVTLYIWWRAGKKNKKVHRLVAETFIPKIEWKEFINHKNGIPTDNNVENLERCTQLENVHHSIYVLGKSPDRWDKSCKWVIQYDLNLNHIKTRKSQADACRYYWLHTGSMSNCVHWRVKQYWWYIRKIENPLYIKLMEWKQSHMQ